MRSLQLFIWEQKFSPKTHYLLSVINARNAYSIAYETKWFQAIFIGEADSLWLRPECWKRGISTRMILGIENHSKSGFSIAKLLTPTGRTLPRIEFESQDKTWSIQNVTISKRMKITFSAAAKRVVVLIEKWDCIGQYYWIFVVSWIFVKHFIRVSNVHLIPDRIVTLVMYDT